MIRRIINEMKKRNWSQIDLSKKAGVSQSTINRILNSAADARIGTLNKVAYALKIPIEYLVVEDESKAFLCLEISRLDKNETQETLLYFEKEKLFKESKKAS